jgi:hypothetical protein
VVITTVHPTDNGDEVFVTCDECGVMEPLGLMLDAPTSVIDDWAGDWEDDHICTEPQTDGFVAAEFPA